MDHDMAVAAAQVTDNVREATRALVAGFVTDGYTEPEARALTVFWLTGMRQGDGEQGEG